MTDRERAARQCLAGLALVCLLLAGCRVSGVDDWPFTEPESEHLPGSLTVSPLFSVEWKESTAQWGIRPLFSVRQYYDVPPGTEPQFDVPFFAPHAVLSPLSRRTPPRTKPGEGDSGLQIYALYPLFRHESGGPISRTTFIPLYYNTRRSAGDDRDFHTWGLFPLYFGGQSPRYGSYHAVFPLGGTLKNIFGREEITFVAFPLYLRTESGGRVSYHLPFPFVNWASGGGRDSWHVWPLIGRSRRGDKSPTWFFLWPFFWYESSRSAGLFPFYTRLKEGDTTVHNALWPFFSHSVNAKDGRSEWVGPWPVLRIGSGPDYSRFQVWPLYGGVTDRHVRRGYFLWPFFRWETQTPRDAKMNGLSLFLLYRSVDKRWKDDRGGDRTENTNILWPLWYYKKDGIDNSYFCSLNFRVFPDPQGWDRFISFAFRFFEHETRVSRLDGSTLPSPWRSTRALWGAFSYDRDANNGRLRVFPLFERAKLKDKRSFHLLMGAFGYTDRPGKRTYRVLFIPWTVSKGSEG